MISVVSCHCGSTESLARTFLKSVGYKDAFSIPIHKGREASLAVTNQLPPTIEKEMLQSLLKKAGKWVIIIGHDDQHCKWSDISRGGEKTRIEAEFVVSTFA